MKGVWSVENSKPVEERIDRDFLVMRIRHRIVRMQLQRATPVGIPIAIEVEQHVDPAIELELALGGEVVVQPEETSR